MAGPSAVAAGRASSFKWVRPEVYPLFAAMGVGVGMMVYSWGRNILNNPEISPNKKYRADLFERSETLMQKAGSHTKSVYRRLFAIPPTKEEIKQAKEAEKAEK